VALALLAGVLCARAAPAPLPNDPRQEISAALFAAAETQAVLQKVADAQLRAAQARITELQRKVAQGDARLRVALAAAQQQFVAELSARDHAYAEAIASFRHTVTDIAATPEGAAALARFNAGDEAGALAILDKLQGAQEEALQIRTNIEKAVGRRHNAELARDARDRGKIATADVITRYEDVTRLDPGMTWDWISLERLYLDAGRYDDAVRAVGRAVATAGPDREHVSALTERGNVAFALGRLDDARRDYEASNVIFRRVLDADPSNPYKRRDFAIGLGSIGRVLTEIGDYAGARKVYEQSLAIYRRNLAEFPSSAQGQRDVSVALGELAAVLAVLKESAAARDLYAEELKLDRKRVAADPGDVRAHIDLGITLGTYALLLERVEKRDALVESLEILRKAHAADPGNAEVWRNLGTVMWNLAEQPGAPIRWSAVVAYFEALESGGTVEPKDRDDLEKALKMAREYQAREAAP